MTELNFTHDNYSLLLQQLSAQLKVVPENNSIIIPKEIGEGIIKIIQLPNYLQALMVKIIFKKDVLVNTGNINEGEYILNFDESEYDEKQKPIKKITSFVRLTGKSFNHHDIFKKGYSINFFKILFNKKWLLNYNGLDENFSLFEKYIPLKSGVADEGKLNEDYRQIINEMWNPPAEDFLQNIFYQNRIMLLIEKFFTRMRAEMQRISGKYKLTTDDILKLKDVEAGLNCFNATPPDIGEIAKKNSMSAIKLSQAFKQVYGTSIYNYYQKQRLQKAYELLSCKKFSVKEVSEKSGYKNFSNFILAFKKHFKATPQSMLE